MKSCIKMKDISISEKILLEIHQRQKEFYDAGINGENLTLLPNFTGETTAEEEHQMINGWIDRICAEREYIPEPELREAMQLFSVICIASFRDGLSARSSSKKL